MSERLTMCPEGHQIEWLTEVVGFCLSHEWVWDQEFQAGERLRRRPATMITDAFVVTLRDLRAQLATATATIAEQTQRASAGRLLDDPALLETLAAIEHERWAGWEEYRAEKSDRIHISGESYQGRWLRQRNTPYENLSESEKESDRIEARKGLAAIRAALLGSNAAEVTDG